MKAANTKADAIFNDPSSKFGRDLADNILIEDRLLVKLIPSDLPPAAGKQTDGPMKVFDVLINKWTITFYKASVLQFHLIN